MTSLSLWGSIASILLVLEMAVFVTLGGVAVFFAYKGMNWLLTNLPRYAQRVLGYVQHAKKWIVRVCRWIALPFAGARSVWAGIHRAWYTVRGA